MFSFIYIRKFFYVNNSRSYYTKSYRCFSSLGKVFLSEIGDGSVDVLDSCVWYSTSGKTYARRWRGKWISGCALDLRDRLRTRGPDTENRILTYYDEPVAAPGRVAALDSQSSAPASGRLSTSGRNRPGDSTTRYDCWCRPPCRCPSPACRTPPTPIWTISICVALDHVLSCIGPRRTAIDSLYGTLCGRDARNHATLTNGIFKIFFHKIW